MSRHLKYRDCCALKCNLSSIARCTVHLTQAVQCMVDVVIPGAQAKDESFPDEDDISCHI